MESDDAREEFESLLRDDAVFQAQWGNKTRKGYTEKAFNEWIKSYDCIWGKRK